MNNIGYGISLNHPPIIPKKNQTNKGVFSNLPFMGRIFSIFGRNKNPNLKDVGNCKWEKSNEQQIFGPYLWTAFHLIAVNYPDEPTKPAQLSAINFIKGIPYMIPCANCGYHFKEFLSHDYLPSLNNNLEKKFETITNSKTSLVTFFVEAHNNVTRQTNKNGKLWTTSEALEYYSEGYRHINPDIIPWEDQALKRARNSKCKEFIITRKDGTKQCKEYEII